MALLSDTELLARVYHALAADTFVRTISSIYNTRHREPKATVCGNVQIFLTRNRSTSKIHSPAVVTVTCYSYELNVHT